MTHLTFHLVRSDLRAAPGRALATAALLGVACLLPSWGLGAVLAFAVAGAATTGTIAAHERRRAVLAGNGSTAATDALMAAATILVPALVGTAGALAVGALAGADPAWATTVLVGLVVPLVAAPNAALALGRPAPSARRSGGGGTARPRGRSVLAVTGWVALGAISPLLMLACMAYRWTTRPRRHTVAVRLLGIGFALAVIVGSTVVVGSSSTFAEMAMLLVLFGPATAVAVAIAGTNLLELVGTAAGRVGPRARIALTPLTGRSRSLGPIVAILAVVSALAVLDPTVGASFGQREADHERTIPTRTRPAGTSPDQAIAPLTPFVDPTEVREIARRATSEGRTRAAVIERVGYGTTRTYDRSQFFDLQPAPTVWLGADQRATAPIWLGVVEPADLAVMGLEGSVEDLATGKLVVLNPALSPAGGRVGVHAEDGTTVALDAVPAKGPRGGVELPGGLVSRSVAERLGQPVTVQSVVVAPGSSPVPAAELRDVAGRIATEAAELPDTNQPPMSQGDKGLYQLLRASMGEASEVAMGDDRVVVFESGALNEVPILARTGEQGRDRLVGLGALAILVTVAGVGLALGATRTEDAVLAVQGAPPSLRAAVGATQAAVMAVCASVVAAAVGIGLPALAFATYNADADLPDIPLVVPAEVWVLLVGLPIVAAGLTGLLLLVTDRSRSGLDLPVDDLAW